MEKYKEIILYSILIVLSAIFLFQKIQPAFLSSIDLFGKIKTNKELLAQNQSQLQIAKAKEERKKRLNLSEESFKKIYSPTETVDAETSFSVLFDDIMDMVKANQIKLHSIRYIYNPAEDSFVKEAPDRYLVCTLVMRIVTNYTDLENLLQDIQKYAYLVNISSIEVYPYEKNKRILLVNLKLTLYSEKSASVEAPPISTGEQTPQASAPPTDANSQVPTPPMP